MKVGCQSLASTAASNRPNWSSASVQCAGAGAPSAPMRSAQDGGVDRLGVADAGERDERLAHRHAGEAGVEVDLAPGVRQLRRPRRLARRVAQDLLGEVHQVVVVPVRRVELHHRELGVVADRDSLVAKAPVDLEHALEAADDEALQVELGGDAQEHLLVERVVVGDERLRVGAARDRMEHRRLDLHEAVLDHEAADRRQRLAARDEARPRGVVGDQVLVAMAILLLGVGDAVELVGQRPQALGEQAQALDLDGQLAGLGLEERALGADDVAEVEALEVVVGLGADRVDADAKLDPAGRVLHGREAGLAHDALEHQPAGDRDGDRLRLERLVVEMAVLPRQLDGAVPGLEVVREGDAAGADRGELVAALGEEGVVVARRNRGGRRRLRNRAHGAR